MRKFLVIFVFVCIALGEWQLSDETELPKGIQVNDLTLSTTGELWILSSSSILKYTAAEKDAVVIQSIRNGKRLAMQEDIVFILDNNGDIFTIDLEKNQSSEMIDIALNTPEQIHIATVDNTPCILVNEPNRVAVIKSGEIVNSINVTAEKLQTVPRADYTDKTTPFFTLMNNRIHSWTGGTPTKPEAYKDVLLYSASHSIIDFTADQAGNLYILFPDSIIGINANGDFMNKTVIEKTPNGSRILVSPANNSSMLVYNPVQKTLAHFSRINKTVRGDIITLHDNKPNPVDNYTEIEFTITDKLNLSVTVYNLIGEPVKVIAKRRFPKGTHHVVWHADDEKGNLVPNGIYFYRLESKKGVAIKQLIVLR